MSEPSPTLNQMEGHWPGDVGFPVPWIHTKTVSLFTGDQSTRQGLNGCQLMEAQEGGFSLSPEWPRLLSQDRLEELSLWAQQYSVSFFFFFLSSSSKSMSAWQTEETSVWLSRPRQSDCKEGTTSHAPPQTLNKPAPASTLCANLRETCPAPPFPGWLCCDQKQMSRSQISSQGIILPWSWPHLVWERKAICGSPG